MRVQLVEPPDAPEVLLAWIKDAENTLNAALDALGANAPTPASDIDIETDKGPPVAGDSNALEQFEVKRGELAAVLGQLRRQDETVRDAVSRIQGITDGAKQELMEYGHQQTFC